MPHSQKGRELKVGDVVWIPAVVESIQPGIEYCNCTVRTQHPMPPYKEGQSIVLNTKQVLHEEELP